jgi:AraC-like DNA-binding protein
MWVRMRRSSGVAVSGPPHARAAASTVMAGTTRLRTVRADGTPVYRLEPRPGRPPVSVVRFDPADPEVGGDAPPRDHRHAHDFLVLVYVERGAGSVQLEGTDHDLRDGDVYPIGPAQVMGVGSIDGLHGCKAWSAFFLPDAVPTLAGVSPLAWAGHPLLAPFVREGVRGGRLVVRESDRPRWSAWFAELEAETRAPERVGSAAAASAVLTRMLVETARLTADQATPSSPPVSGTEALVGRVLDVIEARYREPVSAGDIARALGYTPGHLTTVMRERTGRTVLEWLTERRMAEVRRLLVETDLPLRTIAQRTGHRDAAYLARRFRERHGTTPARWRRQAWVAPPAHEGPSPSR